MYWLAVVFFCACLERMKFCSAITLTLTVGAVQATTGTSVVLPPFQGSTHQSARVLNFAQKNVTMGFLSGRPVWFHDLVVSHAASAEQVLVKLADRIRAPPDAESRLFTERLIKDWVQWCVKGLAAGVTPAPCERQGSMWVLTSAVRERYYLSLTGQASVVQKRPSVKIPNPGPSRPQTLGKRTTGTRAEEPAVPPIASSSVVNGQVSVSFLTSRPRWFHDKLVNDQRSDNDATLVADLMRDAPEDSLFKNQTVTAKLIVEWRAWCVKPLQQGQRPCELKGEIWELVEPALSEFKRAYNTRVATARLSAEEASAVSALVGLSVGARAKAAEPLFHPIANYLQALVGGTVDSRPVQRPSDEILISRPLYFHTAVSDRNGAILDDAWVSGLAAQGFSLLADPRAVGPLAQEWEEWCTGPLRNGFVPVPCHFDSLTQQWVLTIPTRLEYLQSAEKRMSPSIPVTGNKLRVLRNMLANELVRNSTIEAYEVKSRLNLVGVPVSLAQAGFELARLRSFQIIPKSVLQHLRTIDLEKGSIGDVTNGLIRSPLASSWVPLRDTDHAASLVLVWLGALRNQGVDITETETEGRLSQAAFSRGLLLLIGQTMRRPGFYTPKQLVAANALLALEVKTPIVPAKDFEDLTNHLQGLASQTRVFHQTILAWPGRVREITPALVAWVHSRIPNAHAFARDQDLLLAAIASWYKTCVEPVKLGGPTPCVATTDRVSVPEELMPNFFAIARLSYIARASV